MKTHLPPLRAAFIVALFLLLNTTKAQYVTIPDPDLLQWLQEAAPNCMNGNQLDTTCEDILNYTSTGLAVAALGGIPVYNDMTGLQYFKNLDTLSVTVSDTILYGAFPPKLEAFQSIYGHLMHLPAPLPNTLQYLDIDNNSFQSLPALPSGLRYLDCSFNIIPILPTLPTGLDTLIEGSNFQNINLTTLPPNLKYLDCSLNSFTALPPLPDSLTYLNLSYQYDYCPLPSILPPGLTYLDCSGDSIISLPSLPATLQALYCTVDNLTSIPALPAGLIYLGLRENRGITSLPTTLPPGLITMDCEGLAVTSLPPWPSTLTNLSCGYTKTTNMPKFPDGITFLDCYADSVTSLQNFPASATTIDCGGKKLSSLPALPDSLNTLSCINAAIGSLPSLPNTLIDLQLNNCTKLTYIPALPDTMFLLDVQGDSSLSCLPALTKMYNIIFSGCPVTCLPDYGSVQNSTPALNTFPLCGIFSGCPLYWNIGGSIYYDANNDCIHQQAEPNLYPVKMNLYRAGNLVQQTIFPGVYSFRTGYGAYTVGIDTPSFPFEVSCQSPDSTLIISAADSLQTVNFEAICKDGFDVGTNSMVALNPFFPGDTSLLSISAGDLLKITYGVSCNTGGLSGQVQIIISGPATYAGTAMGTPAPDNVTGNALTWNVSDYSQLNNTFNIRLAVDSNATVNQTICVNAIVTPTAGDDNIINNNVTQCFIIVNSYDPNYKEVSPPDSLPYPYNNWITYTIHFQNTGSAASRNIYVTDTLDANVDPTSFELLAYSKAPLVQISGRYITFNFPQINLPDSVSNPDGSIGFVQYRVKPLPNLALGVTISNTAYIYFDFNAPVATNVAVTTVFENVTTSVAASIPSVVPAINIFPNPSTGLLNIIPTGFTPQWISIFDVEGRMISEQTYTPQINIGNVANGIYFIEVKNRDVSIRQKVAKLSGQ